MIAEISRSEFSGTRNLGFGVEAVLGGDEVMGGMLIRISLSAYNCISLSALIAPCTAAARMYNGQEVTIDQLSRMIKVHDELQSKVNHVTEEIQKMDPDFLIKQTALEKEKQKQKDHEDVSRGQGRAVRAERKGRN